MVIVQHHLKQGQVFRIPPGLMVSGAVGELVERHGKDISLCFWCQGDVDVKAGVRKDESSHTWAAEKRCCCEQFQEVVLPLNLDYLPERLSNGVLEIVFIAVSDAAVGRMVASLSAVPAAKGNAEDLTAEKSNAKEGGGVTTGTAGIPPVGEQQGRLYKCSPDHSLPSIEDPSLRHSIPGAIRFSVSLP